jgi:predicted nuclease of predicted toxin-antitoxin system
MRVLLDECVPKRLRQELPGHTVKTVVEMGWSGVKNGALLQLATADFDCFLTVDRNLQFQQNVVGLKIGVIILHAQGNDLASLQPLMQKVRTSLEQLTPGQVVSIRD